LRIEREISSFVPQTFPASSPIPFRPCMLLNDASRPTFNDTSQVQKPQIINRKPSPWSPKSSVGIAMSYVLEVRSWILDRDKRITLYSTAFRRALGPTQPPIQCVPRALSPRVKRPGRGAYYSPSSSAEVKNSGVIRPLPYKVSWPCA
jgi:hypothetical protein